MRFFSVLHNDFNVRDYHGANGNNFQSFVTDNLLLKKKVKKQTLQSALY